MLAINTAVLTACFCRPAKTIEKLQKVTYSSIKPRQRMPLCCILRIDMRRQCTAMHGIKMFVFFLLALFFAQRQNVGCLDLFGSLIIGK